MLLNLSEIFLSIQGEGPHLGRLVVFVRFSGCNLRCRWGNSLCDTPYTSWEPETNLVEIEQIIERITHTALDCRHVVITGGEPTLQKGLGELCKILKNLGYHIDIETNGTRPVPAEIDTVVCSPKLSDSTPLNTAFENQHKSERMLFMQHISGKDPRLFLKFVISPSTHIQEILEIVESLECPKERVYLMPEGKDAEVLAAAAQSVAELAMLHGFNFSPRLHIMLWGNVRGK